MAKLVPRIIEDYIVVGQCFSELPTVHLLPPQSLHITTDGQCWCRPEQIDPQDPANGWLTYDGVAWLHKTYQAIGEDGHGF